MVSCPFCSTDLPRKAIRCEGCNAQRGFMLYGATPDRPSFAVIKGVVLPLALLPASIVGFVMRPTPLWLGVVAVGVAGAIFGIRKLLAGSRWHQI
jgi:hypothetical protein